MIDDFVTGQPVPLVGAEENRQALARFLVEEKGFAREDIEVDAPLAFSVDGQPHESCLDLVVSMAGRRVLVVKVAAASLGSREREAVAAARLAEGGPVPLAAVSDGADAILLSTATGKVVAQGLASLPDPARALELARSEPLPLLEGPRLRAERLIFRSFDADNVNVARRMDREE
ncbi:MAG: type I restriction enzyme HsdR N-terminal domain-containing protein [Proteobacteria bacterium]|nr:type I restriction enzyme HsdR N-terminal domain-containing protein [Pseudomonadota bacterium]